MEKNITLDSLIILNNENIISYQDNLQRKLINFTEPVIYQIAESYYLNKNFDSAMYYLNLISPLDNESFYSIYLMEIVNRLKFEIYSEKKDYKNSTQLAKEIIRLNTKLNQINPKILIVEHLKNIETEKQKQIISIEKRQKEFIILAVAIILIAISIFILILYNRYKKIQLLNRKLDEANSTKNKLFRIISHDLNNPLNSTIMLSEQLLKYHDRMEEEDRIKNTEGILQSGKHLKGLLESLIEWSKVNLEGFKKREGKSNVKDLVNSIMNDVETNLKWKEIEIVSNIDENLELEFERDALRIVLRNIITNSIKFCRVGGKIDIVANHNEIIIDDDGVGFTQEQLSNNFDSNTSRAGTQNETGLGLGLQIVNDICKTYNTKVAISNREEGGGRVKLSLQM